MINVNVKRQRGDLGERIVADYLEKDGFTIVTRNYRLRTGEVDLIAERGDLMAFVEVKARSHSFFDLTEVISKPKQRRIIACAKRYIMEHSIHDKSIRFDVALIEDLDSQVIMYIPDAFTEQLFGGL